MKLKDLKTILYSQRGMIQFAIVYDSKLDKDIETSCSIDYAVKTYGDREVSRIGADKDMLVIIL